MKIDYAKKHKIPVNVTKKVRIALISICMAVVSNAEFWKIRGLNRGKLSFYRESGKSSDKPTYIEVDFKDGTPVSIDGKVYEPLDLIKKT